MRFDRIFIALCMTSIASSATSDSTLRNWFDDPFFQVRSSIPGCPEPLGPRTTGDEMKTQTHNRSERGTRCWLEGRCRLPNSFLYDPEIASAVGNRFSKPAVLADATLWVTVQRRIVWIEGCVGRSHRSGQIEKLLKDVPDVELVIVNVSKDRRQKPPYRTL